MAEDTRHKKWPGNSVFSHLVWLPFERD